MLAPLPPRVQQRVDELVAMAPPLTDEQKRTIRRALLPRPALPRPGEQPGAAA